MEFKSWKKGNHLDHQSQQNYGCLSPCMGAGSSWVTPAEPAALLEGLSTTTLSHLVSAAWGLLHRDACLSSSSATGNEAWQCLLIAPASAREAYIVSNLTIFAVTLVQLLSPPGEAWRADQLSLLRLRGETAHVFQTWKTDPAFLALPFPVVFFELFSLGSHLSSSAVPQTWHSLSWDHARAEQS